MSIDLNNDVQEAGVAPVEQKEDIYKSEFFQSVQKSEKKKENSFNYRSNAVFNSKKGYSYNEVKDLSAPELSELVLDNEDGLSAEELIEQEYKKNSTDGREQAILLEGMKFGSQNALYDRSMSYQNLLDENKHELSRLFNFSPLLLMSGRVIPPIVVEADDLKMIEDQYTKRTVKKSYKIHEQAKVLNTPLNWRTYLLFQAPKPNMPSRYALPIRGNEREERIWANGVAQGWEAGTEQADAIMIQKIRVIQRDYIGMLRFKLLRLKNIIKDPISSNLKLGVTKDGDTLNIDEQVFEIVEVPQFNLEVEEWLAISQIDSPIDIKQGK